MKVVKEGKWNVPWSDEFPCGTCEAVLLVEEDDVKPVDNASGKYYFVCAVCGKQNDLPSKGIAQRVREAVDKKRKYWSSGDW